MEDLNRKFRIVMALNRVLPSWGGENYFSRFSGGLTRRGHEVHVFTTLSETTTSSDYYLHLVPVLKYPTSLGRLCFVVNSARLISSYNFDIVHEVDRITGVNFFNPRGGVEKAYGKKELSCAKFKRNK